MINPYHKHPHGRLEIGNQGGNQLTQFYLENGCDVCNSDSSNMRMRCSSSRRCTLCLKKNAPTLKRYSSIFGVRFERRKVDKKSKPTRKLKHVNSILEYFEYFCHMSSKLIGIILSYTVSKLVRLFETQCSRSSSSSRCRSISRRRSRRYRLPEIIVKLLHHIFYWCGSLHETSCVELGVQ